jgi:hypothetical protein
MRNRAAAMKNVAAAANSMVISSLLITLGLMVKKRGANMSRSPTMTHSSPVNKQSHMAVFDFISFPLQLNRSIQSVLVQFEAGSSEFNL